MSTLRRSLQIRLDALGIEPNRLLGQHFLTDESILERIVLTAGVQSGDGVLEIGAGPGQLTDCLLRAGARVTTIERDTRFLPLLAELETPALRVAAGDARAMSFTEVLPDEGVSRTIGNLPYYITTELIEKCLIELPYAASHTFLIQTEAARRLISSPGSKAYGPLSVLIRRYGEAAIRFLVPAAAFLPPPHVASALLHLERRQDRPPDKTDDMLAFGGFLKRLFKTRRKTIASIWKREFGHDAAAYFETLGVKPADRAETLSPDTIYRLFLYSRDVH